MIIVRIPKRLAKRWLAKHLKDGLDGYKIATFIEFQYKKRAYEAMPDGSLFFAMRFQKRFGKPMRAKLWVRERKFNEMVELILVRGHVESV